MTGGNYTAVTMCVLTAYLCISMCGNMLCIILNAVIVFENKQYGLVSYWELLRPGDLPDYHMGIIFAIG
jgi:hypothetical protein